MKKKICLEINVIGNLYCSVKCTHYNWDRGTMACPWCSLFEFCLQTTNNDTRTIRVKQCLDAQVLGNKLHGKEKK